MKKMMMAAILASAMCMFGADAAPAAAPAPTKQPAPAAARPKMTPEQREAFREKMMAARKARQAERQVKVTEVLKEAGLTDEQAKAAADKIEAIYLQGRRGPQGTRRSPRKAPPRPAPAK